ncbi:hypothetical protein M9H77_03358 [Catharanthus roseus]|uniref:Uncharacterized protein n=1 Tax=Catharanthus roseus TaxID=4058 RepID=A0ACC0CB25_CATRO|nr:hypothetical protein M9H77_03358 [Catharanthus roseus]
MWVIYTKSMTVQEHLTAQLLLARCCCSRCYSGTADVPVPLQSTAGGVPKEIPVSLLFWEKHLKQVKYLNTMKMFGCYFAGVLLLFGCYFAEEQKMHKKSLKGNLQRSKRSLKTTKVYEDEVIKMNT